jgi:hypothetical protein
MEEYSGPGQFGEKGLGVLLSPYCRGTADLAATTAEGYFERRFGRSSTDARWCINAETGRFAANLDPDQGYPPIDARVWEFGASVRLTRVFDVGAGAGWITFTAEPGGREIKTHKFRFTPVRVVARPAMAFRNYPTSKERAAASVVKAYLKWSYVAGELTGADFGAPANPFREDGEMIASAGLMLDAFELLRAIR